MTKKQLEKLNAIDEEIGLLECDFWCAHFNAREAARKHKESSLAECLQDIEMVSQRIQELRNTRNLLEQKYLKY